MKIFSLSCSGFRGIKEPLSVDIPDGFLIITGRNGSGKSSFCDILEYGLSGKLQRHDGGTDHLERIDDYIWWRGQDGPEKRFVSVQFVDDDGESKEILRGPYGIDKPSDEDTISALLCDMTQAPESAINKLLQTSIIRDEEITRLSVDLGETQRYGFVREAVGEAGISKYSHPLDLITKELRAEMDRRDRAYTRARHTITHLVEAISTRRADLAGADDVAAAERLLRDKLGGYTEPEIPARRVRALLVDMRERLANLEELARRLRAIEITERKIASDDFHRRGQELLETRKKCSDALSSIVTMRKAADVRVEQLASEQPYSVTWTQLLRSGSNVGLRDGHCPLCGSEIDQESFDTHIHTAGEVIAHMDEEVAAAIKEQADAVERERQLRHDLNAIEQNWSVHQEEAALIETRYQAILLELDQLDIFETVASADLMKIVEDYRVEVRATERAMLLIEAWSARGQIRNLENELRYARLHAESAQGDATHAKTQWESSKRALDAVRRIEGEIVEERLAALGPLLEELYLRLRPHMDWPAVRYHIRGDVRRFLSLKVGDNLSPRFMFSSGQKRALGIAFLLAARLSTDWTRLRTIVLDDPVQHVDDFRALHLVELFSSLRRSGWQIICTVEDPELAELMARRLRGVGRGVGALISLEYQPGCGTNVENIRYLPPLETRVMQSA